MAGEQNELTILVKLKDLASRALRKMGLAADQTFRRTINWIGKTSAKLTLLSAGLVAASLALARMAKTRLDALARDMDYIGKTSLRLGVTVQSLVDFEHVAELSGLTVQELSAGLAVFSRNLEDARLGVDKKRRAFQLLGLDVDNLVGKEIDLVELMVQVARGMEGAGTATQKTAALMEIFGRSGSKVGSIVKQGAGAIRDMATEARLLNGELDARAVKLFEDYNDAQVRIGRAFRSLAISLAKDILPTIVSAMDRFAKDLAKNRDKIVMEILRLTNDAGSVLLTLGDVIGVALTAIGAKLRFILIVFQSLASTLLTMEALFRKLQTAVPGAGAETFDKYRESATKAQQATSALLKSWKDLMASVSDPGKISREIAKILGPIQDALQRGEAARARGLRPGGRYRPPADNPPPPEVEQISAWSKMLDGLTAGLDEAQRKFADTFNVAQQVARAAANAFESLLSQQLEGLILGTTKVSDAFKEMGKGILRILAQLIAKLIATRLAASFLGGLGFGPLGGGGGGGGGGGEAASIGGGGGGGALESRLGGGGPAEINVTIVANDAKGFDALLTERRKTIEDIFVNAMGSRRNVIVDVRGRR